MDGVTEPDWDNLPWVDSYSETVEYNYLWASPGLGTYEAQTPRRAFDQRLGEQRRTHRHGTVLGRFPDLGTVKGGSGMPTVTEVITPTYSTPWVFYDEPQ